MLWSSYMRNDQICVLTESGEVVTLATWKIIDLELATQMSEHNLKFQQYQ